jgi:hypothetical protein
MAWNNGGPPWEPSNNQDLDRKANKGTYWPYGVGNYGPPASSSPPASPPPAPSPPPPPPAPPLPVFKPIINNKNFKVAPSDIIQFDDESVEIALISDLLFEDIGAVELANISRFDLIDGQPTIYSPIKNLPTINREYDPNNIVSVIPTSDYFSRFGINLISRGMYYPYFDNDGNLIIEIETVENQE